MMIRKMGEFFYFVATPLDAGIHGLVAILTHLVVSAESAVSTLVDIDNYIDNYIDSDDT